MLMKDLIDKHFHEGFTYKRIISLLKNCHDIKVSLCGLHRFLRRVNFHRKEKQSPLLEIVTFIQHELVVIVVVLVWVIERYTKGVLEMAGWYLE